MGAVELPDVVSGLAGVALEWALAVPLLLALSRRLFEDEAAAHPQEGTLA